MATCCMYIMKHSAFHQVWFSWRQEAEEPTQAKESSRQRDKEGWRETGGEREGERQHETQRWTVRKGDGRSVRERQQKVRLDQKRESLPVCWRSAVPYYHLHPQADWWRQPEAEHTLWWERVSEPEENGTCDSCLWGTKRHAGKVCHSFVLIQELKHSLLWKETW